MLDKRVTNCVIRVYSNQLEQGCCIILPMSTEALLFLLPSPVVLVQVGFGHVLMC